MKRIGQRLPVVMLCSSMVALCVAGCEPANSLDGSISSEYSLEFDLVDAWVFNEEFLTIDYIKDDGQLFGALIACQISIETDEVSISLNTPLDGAPFVDWVDISRFSPAGGNFPLVESGSITFDEYTLDPGQNVSGEFEAIFVDGTDIRGRFIQRLREVLPEE